VPPVLTKAGVQPLLDCKEACARLDAERIAKSKPTYQDVVDRKIKTTLPVDDESLYEYGAF
jgi:hypothetical protein